MQFHQIQELHNIAIPILWIKRRMFIENTEELHRCTNMAMNAFTSFILVFSITHFISYFEYKIWMLLSYFKTNLTLFFTVRCLP